MVPRAAGATASGAAAQTQTDSSIAARLGELRELAASDPAAAQQTAWAWVQELGRRRATEHLSELYKLGDPPTGLDGPTEGILVVPLIQGAFDRVLSTVTGGWMPWLGKSFDAGGDRGYQRLAPRARPRGEPVWP